MSGQLRAKKVSSRVFPNTYWVANFLPMKRAIFSALVIAAALLTPPTHAADKWVLTTDNVSLGMNGVSPHVEKTGEIDRVWRSDGPSGTVASDCNAAGVCTNVSLSGNFGNDFTVVTFPNGNKRGYFKTVEGDFQQVYSAPCTDSGCTSLGTKTATSSEMRVSKETRAWGVPDPVLLPDGRVRIYIVEMPVLGKCKEKIATYISSDGISFTKEPGWRFEGGYVDTEVIRAKDGDWVMIMADIACTSSNRQELFVSTSKDGLSWSTPQMLNDLGGFDPTGYEVSPNVFRIYFAQESRLGANDFAIKRGTLKVTASSAQETTTSTKPSTKSITCVKNKKTKIVSGANPKCPKGYKKK